MWGSMVPAFQCVSFEGGRPSEWLATKTVVLGVEQAPDSGHCVVLEEEADGSPIAACS